MTNSILPIALLALLTGSSGSGAPMSDAPTLRLPRTFLPTEYRARLAVDPTSPSFRGQVEIEGTLSQSSRVIWLNAQALTISEASLTSAAGEQRVPLEVAPAEKNFVALRAREEIGAGTLRLSITYEGSIDPVNSTGIFRQEDEGAWYAFTQFEATDARRAFPCFDEPDVKVPWQLTLEVPAGSTAVSNTPILSQERGADGSRVIAFARTQPLPAYLIAFAVGPFDFVDVGKSRGGAPVRVVMPKGHEGEAAWAIESTLPLLSLLEDYFGTPYPYEKLDLVSVPKTTSFGAMENAGMITYTQSLLLQKPADSTISVRRAYAVTAAHEMAHMWFGDLVTMRWWDDTWLNEAFATWMEGKIVTAWRPEWDGAVDMVDTKAAAMGADNLKTAREIHQPIETDDDIENAFDTITYQKGAAIIRSFELWIGEDRFRTGVRKYLADHGSGNATSTDFLKAIGEAAGTDVATPFSTFLDQVGAPIVSFELVCAKDAAPTLKLSQKRYLPLASKASSDQVWSIPICVSYAAQAGPTRACTLMTARTGELPLRASTSCPAWVMPNAGELGYYRMQLVGDLLPPLLDQGMKTLSLPERVGLIGDVQALVGTGLLPAADGLELAESLAKDPDRHIVGAAVGIAYGPDEIIRERLRPNYARFIRKTFGERARALGWTPKKGESEDTQILRGSLLGLVADKGEDPTLIAEAGKLAWAWLDDHAAVAPDMVPLVLDVAVHFGDKKLYDRLYGDAKKAKEIRERTRLLGALGGFRNPQLSKSAMELLLTDEFDPRELGSVYFGGLNSPRTRRQVYDFVRSNFATMAAKLPQDWLPYSTYAGVAQCDSSLRDEVESFFTPRVSGLPGGPRILAQAFEQMDLCIGNREALRPSMEAFLEAY